MKKLPIKERLLSNIVVDDNGCWIWQGKPVLGGYGRISINKKNQFAHIVSYETFRAPRPPDARKKGLMVCHRCDVPLCINPDHLWLGTASENQLDCIAKGRGNRIGPISFRKLNAEKVIEIRKKHAEGLTTQKKLAEEYGVSQMVISVVVNNKAWKHIKPSM